MGEEQVLIDEWHVDFEKLIDVLLNFDNSIFNNWNDSKGKTAKIIWDEMMQYFTNIEKFYNITETIDKNGNIKLVAADRDQYNNFQKSKHYYTNTFNKVLVNVNGEEKKLTAFQYIEQVLIHNSVLIKLTEN